jgi:hypothetical protein
VIGDISLYGTPLRTPEDGDIQFLKCYVCWYLEFRTMEKVQNSSDSERVDFIERLDLWASVTSLEGMACDLNSLP